MLISKYFSLVFYPVDDLGLDEPISNVTLCPDGVEWIWRDFGQCVNNSIQWASFILGFISLLLWFFPSLPQIYQNYKRGNCDEALSPIFLCLWFTGDSLNLTGAILTKQLPTQIYVGFYYIVQDCILLGQYLFYTIRHRRRQATLVVQNPATAPASRQQLLNCLLLCGFVSSGALYLNNLNVETDPEFQRRKLMARIFDGTTDEVGYVCGSLSALSYLLGRIPQLWKNYKRQSTEGVSLAMYILIVIANITYGLSVTLGCDAEVWVYYARHLPWLIGSFGCVFLDVCVIGQYYRYRNTKRDDTLPIMQDPEIDEDSGVIINSVG